MSDLHCEVRDCCGDIPLDEMCGVCFQIQSSINDRDEHIHELKQEVARLKELNNAMRDDYKTDLQESLRLYLDLRERAKTAEAALTRIRSVLEADEFGPVAIGEPAESIELGRVQLADEITAALQEPE